MKKKNRLVIILVTLFIVVFQLNVRSQPLGSAEVIPYIEFLKGNNTSAKDYIISLFKEKDIVILCERDHRELVQYNLILDVMKDPYFIDNVGAVYTEVGDRNLNPKLNTFLLSDKLNDKDVRSNILYFQRNAMSPIWDKSNYAYLIKGIYEINKKLLAGEKIQMFPLDFLGVLEDPSPEKLIKQYKDQIVRDSLIADRFFCCFEKIKSNSNKKKALVIMNSRHAFKHDIVSANGYKNNNTGRYIFNKYRDIVTNVLINNWSEGTGAVFFSLMQDGKWDAAFQYLNITDTGFDIAGSPFENDKLDYSKWMLVNNDYVFGDIFDGFVFYQPIGKFEISRGLDGLMDDGFYEEYINRMTLFNEAVKKEVFPTNNKEAIMTLNKQVVTPMNNLEKLQKTIDRWLNDK